MTVAQAVFGNHSWKKVPHYLLAQYLGGFVAAAVVFLNHYEGIVAYNPDLTTFGQTNSTGSIFATYPASFMSLSGTFIDQVIGTAFLMFAVMAVGDVRGTKVPIWLQPLYMCLVITGLCTAFGLNCMAIFNPARDLSPRIFTAIAGWGPEPFK